MLKMGLSQYLLAAYNLLKPSIGSAQGLDLGAQDSAQVVSSQTLFPQANISTAFFLVYLFFGVALLTYFFLKKRKSWAPPIFIQEFPVSAKVAVTLTFISYGFVHALALLEVFAVTKVAFKSTSEYFFYMNLPKLLATSHAHFFGHGTMYFITSTVFIFSKLKEFWKIFFISLALSAGLLDVPSWWAIKYAGSQFEVFSAIAGMMSVVGWGFMAARSLYEAWWLEIFGRKI